MKTKIEKIRLGGLIKFILLSVCLLFVVLSCSPVTDPSEYYAHPNIMEVFKDGTGKFGVWVGNKFYVAPDLHQATTTSTGGKLNVISDTVMGAGLFYIAKGKDTNSLLFAYEKGALGEIEFSTLRRTFYLDSSYAVSSAVYMPNSTQYIYFYSFGAPKINAGYYLFDKIAGKYKTIFNYASDIGTKNTGEEYVHGFDISPDGKKLLSPVSMEGKQPLIVEYDLEAKTRDTIKIKFEQTSGQQCLWLRYNSTGDKILYSSYSILAYAGWSQVTNEVGVYDKQRNKKTILPVNTDTRYGSVSVAPVWSSDDKHILYCSARCSRGHGGGPFYPYIFQDVEGYLREH